MQTRLKTLPLVLRISALLILAAAAFRVSSVMMDSIQTYRSPLRANPPQVGAPLGEPVTRRLVFVIVDGLRVDTAADPQVMPMLAALRSRGASATLHSRTPSFSQPGFATLLTGAWPEINDSMAMNANYEDILPYSQDNLFSSAELAGLKTAIAGYFWFEKLLPQSLVDASYYSIGGVQSDRAAVDAALGWLDDPQFALILIHLDSVDSAGHHLGGPQDALWKSVAHWTDNLIGEIAAKLNFNQDTLLIASDHGHIDKGGHGGQDAIVLVEPFVLVGHGVRPGDYGDISMTAVAPTASALLGLNLPASAQSAPLLEALDLESAQSSEIQAAFTTQQAALADAYSRAIDTPLDSSLTASGDYQAAIEAARLARLNRERLPRIIIAWAIILAPLFLFPWKKWRVWIWLLVGAVLYLLLFNLRYALIDRLPYSISAFRSQDWVTDYFFTTAGISLAAAVLFTGWREHWLVKSPGQVAMRTMTLTLLIEFFLALPVLVFYALYGFIARWTLPDIGLAFLAVFSLIQILMLSGLGLLLAGAGAAVVHWLPARNRKAKLRPQAGV